MFILEIPVKEYEFVELKMVYVILVSPVCLITLLYNKLIIEEILHFNVVWSFLAKLHILCLYLNTDQNFALSNSAISILWCTSDSNNFPWDNLFNHLLFDISIPNCFLFPCCVIVKYSYYLFLTNWDCLVNIHFFSVPTPHLPKAKKQDFRKLLHNNNYTSSTDDNRVSR